MARPTKFQSYLPAIIVLAILGITIGLTGHISKKTNRKIDHRIETTAVEDTVTRYYGRIKLDRFCSLLDTVKKMEQGVFGYQEDKKVLKIRALGSEDITAFNRIFNYGNKSTSDKLEFQIMVTSDSIYYIVVPYGLIYSIIEILKPQSN